MTGIYDEGGNACFGCLRKQCPLITNDLGEYHNFRLRNEKKN